MRRSKLKIFLAAVSLTLLGITSTFVLPGCEKTYSSQIQGEEHAKLTHAPLVPPAINRHHSSKVIVDLTAKEITRTLDDGVEYNFWTFGGQVPGKFIRVKKGDLVEFHLHNDPTSKMPHNIDMHAVTGPGGGATSSFTAPGHTSVFSFKAEKEGLFVYHCATAPVGMHIANGMYGLILVEPEEGLPPVDREYYVMQGEFYTNGKVGEQGLQTFSLDKALDENPTYVVFNGAVGSLTGNKALPAKVGDKVRIFFGNGGPNLTSSFHLIGEIFDKVFQGSSQTGTDVQTISVAPGNAAMVEFKVEVPGTYTLVDHAIFRAFNKGAIGMLKVTGKENPLVYSGKQKDEVYMGSNDKNDDDLWAGIPDPNKVQPTDQKSEVKTVSNKTENTIENIASLGQHTFSTVCAACHQSDGNGIPNVFPPLAKSDFLNADKERAIHVVLNGKQGPVTVNGKTYNGIMPPQNLSNKQIAAALTYVYNNFGNSGKTVSADEVAKIRNQKNLTLK